MRRSLWIVEKGHASLREAPALRPHPDEVTLHTLWSGISRGTERIVFDGRVPRSEWETMRCPYQEGDFSFPIKYGYSLVGRLDAQKSNDDPKAVFVLYPHQDRVCVDEAAVHPIPEHVPPRRGILAANLETALNAIWDAEVGPGDQVLVVGGGVIGLLTAFIATRIPATRVTVSDVNPERAAVASALGAAFAQPEDVPHDQDVVFHASATEAGLRCALACAGPEAIVVEMSWYGDETVGVPLGGAFHSRRLRLISSQVGTVPPARAPRWSHTRRLRTALELLSAPELDRLITNEIAFSDMPRLLPSILAPGAPGLMTAVRYHH